MKLTTSSYAWLHLIAVSGAVNSQSAGALRDALIAATRPDVSRLIVDLCAASSATRAGLGGLIVAAHLLQRRQRQMRICAEGAIRAQIEDLGYPHLLKCDESVLDAMVALSQRPPARGETGLKPGKAA